MGSGPRTSTPREPNVDATGHGPIAQTQRLSALGTDLVDISVGTIRTISELRAQLTVATVAQEAAEIRSKAIETSTIWRLAAPVRASMEAALSVISVVHDMFRRGPEVIEHAATAVSAPASVKKLKQEFRSRCARELDDFLATGARLSLPAPTAPSVSVLLVLFNQAELTFDCLQSLVQNAADDTEVIILDNASTDRTTHLLERLDGAKVIRSSENLHFLRGVNRAAREACGRHLLLLNNDTRVAPGAIDAAAARLDAELDLGAVGGPIVHLDGTLQEAGAIIWSNGHCQGYGRGGDPDHWEFQFRRDVDYCSGAFLMVRRDVFDALGGFDTVFAPAYFEETDLCMRIRGAGLRVAYEPLARITHFEYGSTDSVGEASILYEKNHQIFVEKHGEVLRGSHRSATEGALRARMRRALPGFVLIVDGGGSEQDGASDGQRLRSIVSSLQEGGVFVTYCALAPNSTRLFKNDLDIWHGVEIATLPSSETLGHFVSVRRDYYDVVLFVGSRDGALLDDALATVRAVVGSGGVIDLRCPPLLRK